MQNKRKEKEEYYIIVDFSQALEEKNKIKHIIKKTREKKTKKRREDIHGRGVEENKRERVEETRRERRERKMKIWEKERRRDVYVCSDFRDSGLLILDFFIEFYLQ
jgi:hypothetical protein